MYKVIYCEKDSFFGEYKDNKETKVNKDELINMLNNPRIFVVEVKYISV